MRLRHVGTLTAVLLLLAGNSLRAQTLAPASATAPVIALPGVPVEPTLAPFPTPGHVPQPALLPATGLAVPPAASPASLVPPGTAVFSPEQAASLGIIRTAADATRPLPPELLARAIETGSFAEIDPHVVPTGGTLASTAAAGETSPAAYALGAPSAEPSTIPAPMPEEPGWTAVGSDLSFRPKWNHGLEFETPDKAFRVHVGGRFQFDMSAFDVDPSVEVDRLQGGTGPFENSANFRRARLRVDGVMWEVVEFVSEYDFSNDVATVSPLVSPVPAPTDLYITLLHLPTVGNLRVGNMKEPISFEHLSSSRWLHFMERSLGFDSFVGSFYNGFTPGIMLFNQVAEERATWWAGVFKNPSNNPFGYGLGNDEWAVTARGTMLPWYDAEGRYLVHLGASYSHRRPTENFVRYRSRASIRSGPPGPLNPILVDTGLIGNDSQDQFNFELAAVAGPWTVQSELMLNLVNDAVFPHAAPPVGVAHDYLFYHSFYAEVLYFLTGEHRAYNRKTANFDRPIPYSNFFCVPGRWSPLHNSGAWQVGLRYNQIDLDDHGVNGGFAQGITLGLNWYLNPNAKFQWNYDWTSRERVYHHGDIHGFGMRMAVDF